MLYHVRLFAEASELLDKNIIEFDVPSGLTSEEFLNFFCARYPELNGIRSKLKLCCDQEYMLDEDLIENDVNEIAIFPTVSGG